MSMQRKTMRKLVLMAALLSGFANQAPAQGPDFSSTGS